MSDDAGGSSNTNQSAGGSKSSRASKGMVYLDRLAVQRAKGIIKDVTFNKRGQPIGPEGSELQSYIGVLARQHVKVSFKEWKDVPKEAKDTIWESIRLVFNVDEIWKKKCLSSANAKWRQWKSTLYSKNIVPHEGQPDKLYNPPPNSRIHKDDWKDFVISRMSDRARQKSKDQKELRSKNVYPHRVSRKGYAGLREEMKDQLTGDEEVDRALLWKQARANKKGEFEGEMLAQTVMKIDEFIRQKNEGTFCSTNPSDDILSQALEKPEHSGRLRAVGCNVTPTVYLNLITGYGMRTEVTEMKKQMAEMNAMMLHLQQQMMNKDVIHSEKGSCSVKNQGVDAVDDEVEVLGRDPSPMVVNVHKDKGKRQVSPKQSVKLSVVDIPMSLKLLHAYGKHALGDECSIKIPVEKDIFGDEQILYIFFDDIHNFCELNPIGASSICVYIMHLYKECVNTNLIDRFRFINPYAISHNPKVNSTEKATIVGKRLIGSSTNQLVFVPCNVGFHWILMVVDPHKEIVYVMDPLSNNCHFDEWKSIMEMAMKIFNMSIGKRTRQNILWEVIMCQQQPDEKQCGFYVMRYMKDIIENRDSLPIALLFTEGFYLKREIDEVRTEWCGILQQFIDC